MAEMIDYTKDRKAFAGKCVAYGVADVTEAEWQEHVVAHPDLSLATWISRVVNARKGVTRTVVTDTILGYPLGGRDFVYKKITIEDAQSQYVPFVEHKTGRVWELTSWGQYNGRHGNKSEIGVETKETVRDDRTFVNHIIRTVTVLDQKLAASLIINQAISKEDVAEEKNEAQYLYKYVGVRAMIGGVGHVARFGKGEDGVREGEYPVDYNAKLCLQLWFPGEDVRMSAQIGPSKFSQLLTDIKDFNLESCKTLEDFELNFRGREVVVFGFIRKIKRGVPETVRMVATALFGLEGEAQGVDFAALLAKEDAQDNTRATGAAAVVDQARANAQAAFERMKEGFAVLGPHATPEAYRQAGYAPAEFQDEFIQDLLKKWTPTWSGGARLPEDVRPAALMTPPKPKTDVDLDAVMKEEILEFVAGAYDGILFNTVYIHMEKEFGLTSSECDKFIEALQAADDIYEPQIGTLKAVEVQDEPKLDIDPGHMQVLHTIRDLGKINVGTMQICQDLDLHPRVVKEVLAILVEQKLVVMVKAAHWSLVNLAAKY